MVAASQGIVKLATSGELPKLEALVEALNKKDKRHDGGVAWVISGANFLALPWPLKSGQKAAQRFKLALRAGPESPRNLYYSGLAALETGDKKAARGFFQRSLDAPCVSVSDRDLEPVLRSQASAGLAKASK